MDTVDQFAGRFKGNKTFYIRHTAPFAVAADGKTKAAYTCYAKNGEAFLPVTKELYREHLNGGDGLAISPLMDTVNDKGVVVTNVCFHAAIDIDVKADFTHLIKRLYTVGFKFVATLSKSGGLHIYFFFSSAEQGSTVIKVLSKLVEVCGLNRLYTSDKDKELVEIFPKQAGISGDHKANCLLLPFYDSLHETRQWAYDTGGCVLDVPEALPFMLSMFTSIKEMNVLLNTLPYSDAPYCIQMVVLTGALTESSGRNKFLFAAAIYLRKKYRDSFYDVLLEMNSAFPVPLEDDELKAIYESVLDHTYDNYPCKEAPCSNYCDKALCGARKYSPKSEKQRGKQFTGAQCWGDLYKVMAAEPYYEWMIQAPDDTEFRKVTFNSVDELQNQIIVQKRCWRDLNWSPYRVNDNVWTDTVNNAMRGIEERVITVTAETDTTEMSELRQCFIRYLTQKTLTNRQPYHLTLGLLYFADGIYYFTTEGFKMTLRASRVQYKNTNLRAQLISYGCSPGFVTYDRGGVAVKIPCWQKADTPELREAALLCTDALENAGNAIAGAEGKEEDTGIDYGDVRF
jgi:hypothetical protein